MKGAKTPCEVMFWSVLPAIRREVVKAMVEEGVKRKKISEAMDITEASISYYISSKRGKRFKFSEEARKDIRNEVKRMVKNGDESISVNICKICSLLRDKHNICKMCGV